ncbi:MAG: carbohydrate ABC transporter permease [Deltaproteobacteria bacterium]|nr:carbohydrate ABC transporter permease [Deltaproteobacteria bacterium]MCB9490254.1 carbohydrate ABC transporter permease [Deltaproteobacteria bacterium]
MSANAAALPGEAAWPRFLAYALLATFALFFVMPVYVMLATSLKSLEEAQSSTMWAWPAALSLDGYRAAFGSLSRGLINSLLLTIPATLLSSLAGSINGYCLSKWKFRGSNTLFTLLLFGMFIPYQSILIPLVKFMQTVGLYNSLFGLILVHVVYGLPITTLIFRNYYATIPDELVEAGRIDGAGLLRTYWYIFLPISMPSFIVVAIWQFTNIWNEFLFAVTLTSSPETQPVTVALQNLGGSMISQWNTQMAGALIASVPTLLIYIVLGKYFVGGMLAGSVKG